MMAMCSYRSMPSFEQRFGRRAQSADLFAVESYLRYQGRQLVDRFDAATYVALTRAMDTHDVARGRGELEEVLRAVRQPAMLVSIDSDTLYLPAEQEEMARLLPGGRLVRLASLDGHDAFLIDVEWLNDRLCEFRGRATPGQGRPRAEAPGAGRARAGGRGAVNLLVLGTGTVGRELLDQLGRQHAALERDYDVDLRVVGVADSRRAVLDEAGVDLASWRDRLAASPETGPFELPRAAAVLEALGRLPTPVLVDVTDAPGMGAVYEEAFARGIHVVASNKLPVAAPLAERERLLAARRRARVQYSYETTVGASLPVLETLRALLRTGDEVRRIEGSLSGTLGFVTSDLARGSPLSLVVRWARELGYTEADPRDDLSGLDSARKAVILARELGLPVSVEDVEREPLLPPEVLAPGSLDDLYEALRRQDDATAARVERLRGEGKVLRYLATVDLSARAVRCGPVEVDADHRAARLQGVEAYVAFFTARHSGLPLVVQGAGVGGALTAGGVLEDVFQLTVGRGAH
jgi:homoserine dehydrogenase